MKYTANVVYNELGKNLTNRKNIIIFIDSDKPLNPDQLNEKLYEKVPKQMIQNFEFIVGGLLNLEVGDFVKVKVPSKYVINGSYQRVVEINDRGIKVDNFSYYFDIKTGKEISKKKNFIPYIEIPTAEEIDCHNYWNKHIELVNEIGMLIDEDCHDNLDNEQLEEIIRILKHKN